MEPRVEPRPAGRFSVVRDALVGVMTESLALTDCNDDGLLDVVSLNGGRGRIELFVGRPGNRFERVDRGLPQSFGRSGTFADLDGDGRDELIIVGNNVMSFHNEGACRFGAERILAGDPMDYPRQVSITDANLDGRADLSITHGRSVATPHRLLMSRGDGTYDEFMPRPTPFPYDRHDPVYTGFAMLYEDLDEDGAMDLFALVDSRQGWFSWGTQPGEIGQSRDECLGRLLATADAMSLSPLDYDRDGRVDWFVSGVMSFSRLLRPAGGRRITDEAEPAGVAGVGVDFAWGSYSFDADLDGWSDLLVLREGNNQGEGIPPDPGPVDVFLNRHDGTFASLGASLVGLSMRTKTLICGPLTLNGEVGCFAVSDDDTPPVLMINGIAAQGRQALVRLHGTVSAYDATGARISLDGAAPPMVFAYGAQAPYAAEHMRIAQIALGARESATVTVRWPSGIEQRGVTVTAGRVTDIREPEAVTLSRRVVPADGSSTVEVTVDAAPLGGGEVRIELAGQGSWAGEVTTDARGAHRVLRAASRPGEARVAVSVGGRALRVRPRVVFAPQ